MLRIFILTISITLLHGCSTVEDPNKSGGIFSTARMIYRGDGGYEDRLKKRQDILARHTIKGRHLDKDTHELEAEKLTISQQLEQEKERLQEIDVAINQLKKDIQNKKIALAISKEDRKAKLQKLKKLKSKIAKLQEEFARKKNASAAEVKRLQEERNKLDKELNLLMKLLDQ